jgi:hypothetical protein
MDEYTAPPQVVDPEVRAYVFSLVSAVSNMSKKTSMLLI